MDNNNENDISHEVVLNADSIETENNEPEGNDFDNEDVLMEEVHSNTDGTATRRDSHSSDDVFDSFNCLDETSSSEEEEAEKTTHPSPRVLKIPKPKHNWFLLKEIAKREVGNFRNPNNFSQRFYGSLHAVQRLELMYKMEKHVGCVNAINFNSSGTRLISGSDDRTVAVWNWMTGKCLSTFNTGHSSNVFQCKYLPLTGDGHIVTCSRDGLVRLALQTSNGSYESSQVLAIHGRACHKISVIKQEPQIVLSAGADGQVFSIDVREKKPERLMFVKEKSKKLSLYSISVNPMNENQFCVSGEDVYVRLYDRRFIHRSGATEYKFVPSNLLGKSNSIYVTCAVFNYNGTEIIGSYNDDDVYMFDTSQPGSNYVHRYEGHRNSETVKGVSFFGPRSEYVVSGSDCGNIYFWDKNTEAIVQWMRGDEDGVVNCLEPHPKLPVLATSGLDSDVKIWVPSCEIEPTLAGLEKVVKLNCRRRACRVNGSLDSLNETLVRWWRQMRYLTRHEHVRDPIFIEIGTIGRTFGNHSGDDSSSSTSFSSSDNTSE